MDARVSIHRPGSLSEEKGPRRVNIPIMSRWIKPFLVGLLVGRGACLGLAASDDPSSYVRQSNWHESLLASLEAVAGKGVEDGFAPFESDTMRGGDAARQIRVPLAGAKDLSSS